MSKSPSFCKAGHEKGPGRCKECRRLYHAKYHEANREKILSQKSIYKKQNSEKCVMHSQKYRAKKKKLLGNVSADIVQKLLIMQRGRCACCGDKLGHDFQLDHIMPLDLGGMHDNSNLQLLKKKCNLEKNAKHPVDFMRQRGKLI
jgi:5-methylcytosine-specific restriction endonuclease McrA